MNTINYSSSSISDDSRNTIISSANMRRTISMILPLLISAAIAAAEILRPFKPALQPTEIALFSDGAESALQVTVFVARAAKVRFDEFAIALQTRVPQLCSAELVVESNANETPRTI